MNNPKWNKIEGYWTEMKGKVKEEWNDLTNDDIEEMEGKREQLVGKLQQRCGCTLEEAEAQVNGWTDRMHAEEPWAGGMTKDAKGAAIGGAAAGAVVGGTAGAMAGPAGAAAGAAIGAVVGGAGSGAAVQEVDKHDHDGSPGEKAD